MKGMVGFNNYWGESTANERLRSSDKGPQVLQAEIENILSDIALRFERGPRRETLTLWARDIVEAGYPIAIVRQVARVIPYKFVRHPSLAEIMELLRPHLASRAASVSDLDKYTQAVVPHVKAKFMRIVGEDIYAKMVLFYKQEVLRECSWIDDRGVEMCLLCDWIRTYCSSKPKDIIEQGLKSNDSCEKNDVEYFIRPLRLYAKENGIDLKKENG